MRALNHAFRELKDFGCNGEPHIRPEADRYIDRFDRPGVRWRISRALSRRRVAFGCAAWESVGGLEKYHFGIRDKSDLVYSTLCRASLHARRR